MSCSIQYPAHADQAQVARPVLREQRNESDEREDGCKNARLTNSLAGDLVASDGDSVPVDETLYTTLKIGHLEVDI